MTFLYDVIHNFHGTNETKVVIKGALSGLRQFLATENPLKMIKNTFYFTIEALFALKIFKFLSRFFGLV